MDDADSDVRARTLGDAVSRLQECPGLRPTTMRSRGLDFLAMLEGVWHRWRIGGTEMSSDVVVANLSNLLAESIRF